MTYTYKKDLSPVLGRVIASACLVVLFVVGAAVVKWAVTYLFN